MSILCRLGFHRWHLMTTGRVFVRWYRCPGCGRERMTKGR